MAMRRTLVLAIGLAVGSLALQGCNEEAAKTKVAETSSSQVDLTKLDNRLSYAIGSNFAAQYSAQAEYFAFNEKAFLSGFADKKAGKDAQVSQEQMMLDFQEFQKTVMQAEKEAHEKALKTNADASAAFLAENSKKEGVVVTDSGLQYKVISEGNGDKPKEIDQVQVHYKGTLVDGTEFDSSYKRGQPVTFGVNEVIVGWTEALQLMSIGSKWQVVIPADLAYGEAGAGDMIGPNSALIFEIELLAINPSENQNPTEDAAVENKE